jgi:hypothetical protein
MDGSSPASGWWTVQHQIAQFQCSTLTGRLDTSHPGHGLHHLALDGRAFDARLLCIYRISKRAKPVEYPTSPAEHAITKGPEWMVADSYVRGCDLVASYLPSKEWPYSPEVYWRVCSEFGACALASISLILSVNTHLLDSWPRISLQSCFTAEEVLFLHADATKENTDVIRKSEHVFRPSSTLSCRLHRLPDRPFSYAEIMPATDFCEARIQHNADNKCYARWELFSHFLEKGVIRRARLQAVVLPRENDVELALRCCRQLENAPLPLTT